MIMKKNSRKFCVAKIRIRVVYCYIIQIPFTRFIVARRATAAAIALRSRVRWSKEAYFGMCAVAIGDIPPYLVIQQVQLSPFVGDDRQDDDDYE